MRVRQALATSLLIASALVLSLPVQAQIYRGGSSGTPTTPTPPPTPPPAPEPEVPAPPPRPSYRPALGFDLGDHVRFDIPLRITERLDVVGDVPVDREGSVFAPDPAFNTQIRLGARLNTNDLLPVGRLLFVYEHDLQTGVHSGGIRDEDPAGLDMPWSHRATDQLRRLYGQFDAGEDLHFIVGYNMSHWGLGLIANDGDHGWTPGSALFLDPREGDHTLRALGVVGPVTAADLAFGVGADRVERDDVLRQGDEARQLVAFVQAGFMGPNRIGAYFALRRQEDTEDGDRLDVQAIDLAGAYRIETAGGHVDLEGEIAFIWGETELGPSVAYPVHDVQQLGGALRATGDFGRAGFAFDFLYASGDSDRDDGELNGFNADVNYQLGLLLFQHVLGAQTGRSVETAFDPNLTGFPNEDLDRLSSRGSITNTISFFPRFWVRPWMAEDGQLEVYGGPLLALTVLGVNDPFNSRIAGGDPRNALNGDPGSYLGTELDLGIRYHRYYAGTELTVGLEAAALLPGSALVDATGETMDSVLGLRGMLDWRF